MLSTPSAQKPQHAAAFRGGSALVIVPIVGTNKKAPVRRSVPRQLCLPPIVSDEHIDGSRSRRSQSNPAPDCAL